MSSSSEESSRNIQGIEEVTAIGNNDEKDSEDEREKIQEDLSTMTFEELMKLKDELGSKIYNEAVFGSQARTRKTTKTDFKRLNKNRPREMSSKRPVPFLGSEERRKAEENSSVRDPRFDEKCGAYSSTMFKTNYEFIGDIRKKEIIDLKNRLKSEKDHTERKNIKLLVQRLENKNREEAKWKAKEQTLKEEQNEIQKARQEGITPHFKTKKERRVRDLVDQYKELKSSGKLGKHLEKRRKKNASKDRKKFSFD